MIYTCPSPDAPIDQGDILDGCPVLTIPRFNADDLSVGNPDGLEVEGAFCRVLVLTQACDLANKTLSPFREHLAKHLADTYSRIGLPEPYQTD